MVQCPIRYARLTLFILFLLKNHRFFLKLASSLFILQGLDSGPLLQPSEPSEPPSHLDGSKKSRPIAQFCNHDS